MPPIAADAVLENQEQNKELKTKKSGKMERVRFYKKTRAKVGAVLALCKGGLHQLAEGLVGAQANGAKPQAGGSKGKTRERVSLGGGLDVSRGALPSHLTPPLPKLLMLKWGLHVQGLDIQGNMKPRKVLGKGKRNQEGFLA
ncbi:hypothetical protein COCNU_07G014370 [Cocos nucifera]|uniref:Uncharacterized protein n=1 Tax=Cocos nucifera TaxID=13894 RepID=A0A8K0N526_COCNU|nr:hypothetical protein COCNU_07G014370 [Cocos nucifera]